ncbi:MAG TPA: CDP-alcohol phosphatidyltransferase family protein [Alphaproteobacteria bacterium]|nr:CDP-alcohol phosphatidyltransferase family protein [Alphaproteobacteria bacterium]
MPTQRVIFNLPNGLSLLRAALTLPLCYFVANSHYEWAFYTLILAGLTDWMDGFFARYLNQTSIFGTIIDPLADKIFVGIVFSYLFYLHLIPFYLFALILLRDLAILAGAFVLNFFKKQTTFKPTGLSKVNTAFQLSYLFFTLYNLAYGEIKFFLTVLSYAVGMLTVLTWGQYGYLFYKKITA